MNMENPKTTKPVSRINQDLSNKRTKKKKPLIDQDDVLRSTKKVLDQILEEAKTINPEIRQNIISARDALWEEFKKEEETINSKTR